MDLDFRSPRQHRPGRSIAWPAREPDGESNGCDVIFYSEIDLDRSCCVEREEESSTRFPQARKVKKLNSGEHEY
jgi:hypothetical protein